MREIRFHGRGGQGAVTAAELLAVAAFYDGKYSQAFPFFGVERRGAPVTAFARIDDKFIRIRSQIYEPDYIIVQDASLLDAVNVSEGLKQNGEIIINTEKTAAEIRPKLKLKKEAKVYTVNATKVALDVLGVPIVNTAMLGALACATKEVTLDSIKKAIEKRFPEKLAVKNIKAVEEAYRQMKE
ncbi:MAG: pyruvate ferredoxin oxidoreductase subunit gamma [Euryarchaeota archaeon]|nr:pyruvate ferredoxin oxidoreductase subunit gamma [Euryarchaeota archaeon]